MREDPVGKLVATNSQPSFSSLTNNSNNNLSKQSIKITSVVLDGKKYYDIH